MVRKKTVIFVYLAVIFLFITIQSSTFFLLKSMSDEPLAKHLELPKLYESISTSSFKKPGDVVKKNINFDPEKKWLVFFHMQKTSGTNFDQEMVSHLQIKVGEAGDFIWKRACSTIKVKRLVKQKLKNKDRIVLSTEYECKRMNTNTSWILSWHETNWNWQCGLHPALSDLKSCIYKKFHSPGVTKSDFYFLSMLREPISRFISEWRHVRKRGSVWVLEDTPKTAGQNCSKGI
jgi:hypothetical protein